MMFGWRRRSEGFEWKEYVRTTVLVRRADRQRRLDDARLAALEKVKDARDRGVNAGRETLEEARERAGAAARSATWAAWDACKIGSRRVFQVMGALKADAARRLQTLPAMPRPDFGISGLAAGKDLLANFPSFLPPDRLLTAAALATVVVVGGRMLSPPTTTASVPPIQMSRAIPAAVAQARESSASELTGRATALSGDVLRIAGTAVRLKGIDAPEPRQSCAKANGRNWQCGQEAREGLSRLVRGKTVTCNLSGHDDQGRPLAECATGEFDIAAQSVRLGLSFAANGILTAFSAEEAAARADKLGLWQGNAERPEDWRQRVWDEAKRQAPDGCPIKGFVRASGRIYALPWSDEYANRKLRRVKGERWFCSEEEARAAGFKLALGS